MPAQFQLYLNTTSTMCLFTVFFIHDCLQTLLLLNNVVLIKAGNQSVNQSINTAAAICILLDFFKLVQHLRVIYCMTLLLNQIIYCHCLTSTVVFQICCQTKGFYVSAHMFIILKFVSLEVCQIFKMC